MSTALQLQLQSLGSLITHKPSFCGGTIIVPAENFVLWYRNQNTVSRINLLGADPEHLQQLAETCNAATSPMAQADILYESYSRAGSLNASSFSLDFDPGRLVNAVRLELMEEQPLLPIRAQLRELSIYGSNSYCRSHAEGRRDEARFGTLIVVLPTRHAGGAIAMRHGTQEWMFDSARVFSERYDACVAYVAFSKDVEHIVLPTQYGYRVTLTYDLYFDPDDLDAMLPDLRAIPQLIESPFKDGLKELLQNPEFLPRGGFLGFGLHHEYPLKPQGFMRSRRPVVDSLLNVLLPYLEGSDAILLRTCQELRLNASIQLLVADADEHQPDVHLLSEWVVDLKSDVLNCQLWEILRCKYSAKLLCDVNTAGRYQSKDVDSHWVTDATTATKENVIKESYTTCLHGTNVAHMVMYLCLIAYVGAAGERETATLML